MRQLVTVIGLLLSLFTTGSALAQDRYVHFAFDNATYHGMVKGDEIRLLSAGLFPLSEPTGESLKLAQVTILPPTEPQKVFAVGMNFASHLSSRASGSPPVFLKLPSSLTAHNTSIRRPDGADNLHFEGELVLVIGKTAKHISEEEAPSYIFGVTAGNDLTERSWQRRDLQWLRAKAADGFGPVGPYIATGLDYNNTVITTRLNDKIVQQENTRNMIHSPAKVVSYLSTYFTLEPGDLIFMGTPGKTKALKNGDEVSVEIDGVGKLSNQIVSSTGGSAN